MMHVLLLPCALLLSVVSMENLTGRESLRRVPCAAIEAEDLPVTLNDGSTLYFTLSSKGNGVISAMPGGNGIRVYDVHDDGSLYRNEWSTLLRLHAGSAELWLNAYIGVDSEEEGRKPRELVVELWMKEQVFCRRWSFNLPVAKCRPCCVERE